MPASEGPSRVLVVSCIDPSYAQHLCVLWESIRRVGSASPVRCVAFVENPDQESLGRLRSYASSTGLDVDVRELPARFSDEMPVWGHVSRATYARMALGEILDEARAIYLDVDTLVVGDLSDLWRVDLGACSVGAVREESAPDNWRSLGLDSASAYFNAGVLLIDLERWRKDGVWSAAVEFLSSGSDRVRFWDQCVLNAVLAGRVLYLDRRWNITSAPIHVDPEQEPPGIVHFSGTIKPWHYNLEHPWKHLYWDCLRSTPWASYRPRDRTLTSVLKKRLIPRRLRELLRDRYRRLTGGRPSS